ncbi:lysophospholipid acyltransferase family protein [Desulfovibrio inopinatus]|uniref:lysophospholipid acyltransferase family protein n=1 Tax=Desulfovibrio inopinatus TaxID=102109 RepID=UPI000688037F|nr:GNAT family N-acyltransferase [Desulfovibrio inopinatus]
MIERNNQQREDFCFKVHSTGPIKNTVFNAVTTPINHLLSLKKIYSIYQSIPHTAHDYEFLDAAISAFDFSYRISSEDRERIPREGPTVVVANHPFGGPEGIFMAHMLLGVRQDIKIMANHILNRISELRKYFVLVDPFGGEDAELRNIAGLKQSLRWLKQGGMLAVFPSGTVSHFHLSSRGVVDSNWSPSVARLIAKTQATVVPVYFDGANSAMFQLMGLVHPSLRTALLPREFMKRRNKTVEVRVGNPISWGKLSSAADTPETIMQYLKMRTYLLQNRQEKPRTKRKFFVPKGTQRNEALIAPLNAQLMADEIGRLPQDCFLVQSGDYDVIAASARRIPLVLREIGRLREFTFRKVGEGSGKACDLDEFDSYYLHLFIWNRAKQEIVGAYRIGKTDVILKEHGTKGLYISTLFKLKPQFLDQISPALELGRSFVRPEYQKSYSSLLLLWRGVAQIVARNPRYRMLFGPVSITNEYKTASRQLMARFFEEQYALPELSQLVQPRTPLRPGQWLQQAANTLVGNMDDLLELLADIETDQKGIPVLLRQYLKLGGKLLCFNVDHDFSEVLDGLILVDLLQTEKKQLERYMGKEGLARFLAYHEGDGDDFMRCA